MTALQLSPKLAARIRRKLRSSSYGDADRLLTAALQVLDERDTALQRDVAAGFDQLLRGQTRERSMTEIIAMAQQRHAGKPGTKG